MFILIRHSLTRQQPAVSSHAWQLTAEGLARCERLAVHLRPYGVQQLFTSPEAKAQQTAQALARAAGWPAPQIAPAAHETLRHTAPYYAAVTDFEAAIGAAMRRPEVCLFGEEAFGEAQRRLAGCIAGLHAAQPGATLALVTHGTVMALYLAALTGEDPFPLWQSLAMPAYAILDVAAGRRLHLVPALPPD